MNKHYIDAQRLLDESVELALRVFDSGYRPDIVVALWRGGTPIGMALQETLHYLGVDADHIAIRTKLYKGINQRERDVSVHGLEYIYQHATAKSHILLVDDVHDSGLSVQQVINEIQQSMQNCVPKIRVAVPYYKPDNNKTGRIPDYFLHETTDWLVFPHELMGLSEQEVLEKKPAMAALKTRLAAMKL